MNQLFAPWRIEWVEREDSNADFDDCVFCELPDLGAGPAGETDRDRHLVARADGAYVLLNNYPYNPGHVMVIPHAHTGAYGDLDDEALLAKERLLQRTIQAMDAAFDPDGYNVGYNLGGGAAGGSIGDHLHAHVVPRWEGDTNFMPVIGDATVIVEAVDDTWDRLHEAFADQEGTRTERETDAVVIE